MKMVYMMLLAAYGSFALASADVGKPAPDFSLTGNDGQVHKLSEYKGKDVVVLEWFNPGCPYVHKHYDSGNMQRLQKQFTAAGVRWFTIASSAPGKEGYIANPDAAEKMVKEKGMANTALLLDSTRQVARSYGAKTTPHMFVIDKKGLIAYNGAIDSESTARPMKVDEYVKMQKSTNMSSRRSMRLSTAEPPQLPPLIRMDVQSNTDRPSNPAAHPVCRFDSPHPGTCYLVFRH